MPVIPALGRQKQVDLHFQVSLGLHSETLYQPKPNLSATTLTLPTKKPTQKQARCRWFTPVILSWEVEIQRIAV
jgi:hypothetical protein